MLATSSPTKNAANVGLLKIKIDRISLFFIEKYLKDKELWPQVNTIGLCLVVLLSKWNFTNR
jgi:hypothetical protein